MHVIHGCPPSVEFCSDTQTFAGNLELKLFWATNLIWQMKKFSYLSVKWLPRLCTPYNPNAPVLHINAKFPIVLLSLSPHLNRQFDLHTHTPHSLHSQRDFWFYQLKQFNSIHFANNQHRSIDEMISLTREIKMPSLENFLSLLQSIYIIRKVHAAVHHTNASS